MFSDFFRESAAEYKRILERWKPLDILSPRQRLIYRDDSQRIALRGGRRWGKTFALAVRIIDRCLTRPGWRTTFFAKTETDALEILWPDMERLIREYELPFRKVKSNLWCSNGSVCRITGAKDQYEAQRRFRGRGWNEVIGDECQLFQFLKDMVNKAIGPATVRGGYNGSIILAGTPGDVPGVGYWEEIARGMHGQWRLHVGNIRDNPSIDNVEEVLAREAAALGGAHTQAFRVEWLGESAPPDETSGLVYRYNRDVNHFETLPGGVRPVLNGESRVIDVDQLAGDWRFGLGLDLGHTVDRSAILILGATNAAPGKLWLVEEFVFPCRPLLHVLAAECRHRLQRYGPVIALCDEGALGVQTADNLRASPHNIPVTAADKIHPLASSDAVNQGLGCGTIMIPAGSQLAQDLALLRWDPRELQHGRRKMAREPHSDLEPLLRYQWPTFSQIVQMIKPIEAPKTPAMLEHEAEMREVNRLRRAQGRGRNRALLS